VDPRTRPSAVKALKQPWLNKEGWPKVVLSDTVQKSLLALQHRSFVQAAGLVVIAHCIDRHQVADAIHSFEKIDHDMSGVIELDEWIRVMKDNNMPEAVAARSFELIDLDRSGGIRVAEFVAATLDKTRLLGDHMIEAAFEALDSDGTGYVSNDDILAVLADSSASSTAKHRRSLMQKARTTEVSAVVAIAQQEIDSGRITAAEFDQVVEKDRLFRLRQPRLGNETASATATSEVRFNLEEFRSAIHGHNHALSLQSLVQKASAVATAEMPAK